LSREGEGKKKNYVKPTPFRQFRPRIFALFGFENKLQKKRRKRTKGRKMSRVSVGMGNAGGDLFTEFLHYARSSDVGEGEGGGRVVKLEKGELEKENRT